MEDGGGLIKREPYEFVEGNITPQGSDIHFQEQNEFQPSHQEELQNRVNQLKQNQMEKFKEDFHTMVLKAKKKMEDKLEHQKKTIQECEQYLQRLDNEAQINHSQSHSSSNLQAQPFRMAESRRVSL